MRVLVLTTGRTGSMTIARAVDRCVTNYTGGHETRTHLIGDARFAYPEQHLEADNRLTWFLGQVEARFDHNDTVYVDLRRDPEKVAQSYARRWPTPGLPSRLRAAVAQRRTAKIMPAFGHNIVTHGSWDESQRIEVARFYVESVNRNVEAFLQNKPMWLQLWIDDLDKDSVRRLWDLSGMQGEFDELIMALHERHNAS